MQKRNPLPTGTVTFLFTDIQGSTPLWEREPEKMATALQIHNAALRQAIEANGGAVFKTVGDAFQAAFTTAPQALKAAIEGQRALQAASWNELGRLSVRMGLHTGEAELDPGGDEYAVSHTKNRIGRIHSAAHGGQILLSQESGDMVRRTLPDGVTLKDIGEHRLKGMEWLEHLFQVCAPGLPQDFPPLATEISYPNNLPRQLTSFIGRATEIAQLRDILTDTKHSLVTLTGSGGTGKTRLALRVGAETLTAFPDGVWLVELAPLADPDLVAKTTAQALGLHEIPGMPIEIMLSGYLYNKHLLLILDNCEHLLDECSRLADLLLKKCLNLQLLATSREILGVPGETPFRVPSLTAPDPKHLPGLEQMADFDAVRLFLERVEQASPGFALNEANAEAVATLCRRLDGIPLAIELAAARARVMAPQQIAARLDNVFRLLTGGSRSVLPRQQTLKATIDWSYALLSERERLALQRLSVFAGGWMLEAAEAVAGGEDIPLFEVCDVLTSLVDKSLIQTDREAAGMNRFRMLETVRQYAHDRLLEAGVGEQVRDRHLAYYLELAEQAEPHLQGKDQPAWLDRLDADLDNIRLALEWAMSEDIEKGLQLATALEYFWQIRNYWIEGVGGLDRLLAAESGAVADVAPGVGNQPQPKLQHPARSIIRGRALNSSGSLKIHCFDNEKAIPLLEEARAIFQVHADLNQRDFAISLGHLAFIEKDPDQAITGMKRALDLLRKEGDNFLISRSLHFLANLFVAKGDLAQARANSEESLALSREAGNLYREGVALALLGFLELISGRPQQAEVMIEEAQSCFDTLGSRLYSAQMMDLLAHVAMAQGNYLQAIQRSEAALVIFLELNHKVMMMNAISFLGWEAWALKDYDQAIQKCNKGLALAKELRPNLPITAQYILGRVALSRGEYSKAGAYMKELILWLNEKNEPFWINYIWSGYGFKGMYYPTYEAIHAMGVLANAQHQERRAVLLFGAQHALCGWLKNTLSLAERNEYEQALASARAALGEEAVTAAWETGQAMTREQAVALALEEHE